VRRMVAVANLSEHRRGIFDWIFRAPVLQSLSRARICPSMANGLMPLAGLCALHLLCVGCSANHDPDASSGAGGPAAGGSATAQPMAGKAGASAGAGTVSHGGTTASGGSAAAAASAGKPSAGESGGSLPAVNGRSIYALECNGDSKDCHLATVPCFGVSSQTPNVAAGWACANRCTSIADCSDVPSGAEAQASCVPFTSASHCMLVCQNENQSFACPDGMTCYVPPKSPIGYCLWP